MIAKAMEFLSGVRAEVKRVTWPSRREVLGGTSVVLLVVLLFSIFLGLVDTLLAKLIEILITG
ncbi:MAG: preprotein translocase subunit SecE [Nitrospinaceae bacterium]